MGGRRSRYGRRRVFGRDVTPSAGALALWIGGLIALQSPQVLHAKEPPVDASLLEFLGSVDSEDKDWHEYLASTDIDRLAKRAVRTPGSAGAARSPAAPASATAAASAAASPGAAASPNAAAAAK